MTVKTSALSGAWEGYGGFWIRFLAYLVDSVILFIALVLIAAGSAMLGAAGALLVTAASVVGPILYWSVMHASRRQATYGKALLGLKVTDAARDRISFVRSLAREIAKIISAFALMLGFILAAFTKRKQSLHDFFANTLVMREGPSHVVAGLAIGVLGWLAPVALIMVLGAGMFMGAAGMMGGDLMAQVMQQAEKQAAQQRPMPPRMPQKPPAPQVVVKPAPPPPPPAPAPVPVVAAPAPVTAPAPAPVVVAKAEPEPVAALKPKPAAKPKPRAQPKAAPQPPITVVALPPQPIVEAPTPAVQQLDLKASGGPKYNDLMTAVLYKDEAGVNELLVFGKWPDKPDSRGVTPLMAAAMLGDLGNAEALLKAGAQPSRAMEVARERGDGAMMNLLEKYGRK
jgi:uncharacterized RDD family membrane protein YckC